MGSQSGHKELLPASARPHVLLLCSPCMGHLIPFAELARRLVADHGLAATLLFAAATDAPSEQYAALAASVPDGVDLVVLPAPPADALPPSTPVRERVVHAALSAVPHVRDMARSLASTGPLVAVVVDMASVPARDVATELGVPCYMFFTSPWMLLSLFLHLPELDAGLVGEYRDATEPIRLPGCVPIHARELPGSLLADRSSETYAGFLSLAKDAARVDGILVNTFGEVEPAVGQGGADCVKDMPSVHAIGPLVWTRPVAVGVNREPEHARLFAWLDQQPRGSVVFLSFGSGGTLTRRQTTELALALEATGCPFIWAAKRPHEDTADGAFFGTGRGEDDDDDPLGFLPRGFVERTSGLGRVLLSWAPQTAILAHDAVGCFVTHCGWNSSLESILNGVPMVAWPLYAEQKMNAAMLEAHAGVATRVNARPGNGDGFVCKEEIVSVIRRVMDGEEATMMRRRVGELRDRATHALATDGSSSLTLAKVTGVWKSSTSNGAK